MIRICKICGKEFEARTSQQVCDEPHFRECVVCGKQFQIDSATSEKQTCSKECRIEFSNRKREATRKKRSIEHKRESLNEIRGGRYTRICEVCGEEFRTASKTRKICYIPHTRKCCICEKEFPINVYSSDTLTCSSRCASDLRTQRNLERYGVKSTLELDSTKEKIRQTCLERYGVENPMNSEVVIESRKATCRERYGVDYSVQAEEVKAKSRATCMERYGVEYGCTSEQAKKKTKETNLRRRGVEHVFQDPEFQRQSKESCLERYGTEHYVQSDDFAEKAKATWMENYGVDNPLKSPEIRRKLEETSLQRYGARRPQQNEEIHQRILDSFIQNRADSISDPTARAEYLRFKQDPAEYVKSALSNKLTPTTIGNMVGYSDPTIIYEIIQNNNLSDMLVRFMPQMEQDITLFLQNIDPDICIEHHNRKVIGPSEIDIFLPAYNIGFDCNPTATHNSTISFEEVIGHDPGEAKDLDYHKIKTDECETQGIFLFHVFGYEWEYKQEIIKSMIRNLIGKNDKKYFARKLEVREVSYNDSVKFLNNNHRQGFAVSKVNLGLYTKDDELVSLMTFSGTRNTIGHKSDDEDTWELVRFCNKLNCSVVGGASKLFKYFCNHYFFKKIVSFSDRAHTRGSLYSTLGFKEAGQSNCNYMWVNLTTDLALNRVACQKRNLPKLFNEPNLDIKNQTEEQIMVKHGFVQVYDSGTVRWEYENK